MQRELSRTEVERLFIGAVDEALPPADQAVFTAELAQNPELRQCFDTYRAAVQRLKGIPREKAPEAMASMVLRRTRRRRFHLRGNELLTHWHVPVEVLIPLILVALVALLMIIGSP